MQKEYLSAAAEVLSDQGVDENLGLSDDEASSRLAKTGPNKLEEAEKTPLWKRFFEQMADPMVIMLIVAAVISALTGMVKGEADFADVAIIMFVVIVNSVLGVVQEAKKRGGSRGPAGDERGSSPRCCATASSCTCRAPSSCPVT